MTSSARSWRSLLAGRFVVFDGPDGSGKSTQIHKFMRFAASEGLSVCHVREPGGTPVGEQIRTVLLDPDNADMAMRCELLLYMASRAQLVAQRIEPALREGQFVLADRFVSSTLAYQGTAGGMPVGDIRAIAEVALGGCWPHLVVIFDVDEHVAAKRLSPLLDRIEQRSADYHRAVRRGYLEQAAADPAHYLVIDASRDAGAVFDALTAGLRERLGAMPPVTACESSAT